MATETITQLPLAISISGSEAVEIVQGGTSKQTTTGAIAGLTANVGTVTQINTNSPITGGPITTTGTISLATGGVDNTYLAPMAANTIKGNNTGGSAAPQDLTGPQVLTAIGGAPLNSPAFTGVPTAPTPLYSDNSTTLATTNFVKNQGFGSGTVTSITAGAGLTGGTITTSGTIALSTTGVTAATYGSAANSAQITVDAYGRISSASNVAISIPSGQVTGLGTMATQNANSVAITGGTINGTIIGGSTPAAATFTALTATGTSNFNTIASGTWNGSAIAVNYGGTGATTASAARTNLSAAKSGANSDITSLTGLTTPLSAPQGGTGLASFTTGDLLYADTSSSIARLNDVATGNVLLSGGVGVAPSYGKVGLTTHVSGTLPVSNGGTGATTLTGFLKGNGTSAFSAQATIGNSDLTNSSITIGSNTLALGASTLTLAGLTTVTVTQDPTSALQLSTKQYVDGQVSAVSNTTYHTACSYATTADLGTVIYSNGVGGVGATITNAGVQAALSIDGYTFTATDVTNATRVLVKNQALGLQNGIYVVTNQGSALTNWQLTRASDFNTVGTGPNYIQTGSGAFVTLGTLNGSSSWVMNTTGTITVGTTSLDWVQTSSSGNILVTSPLQKSGNTVSLGTVGVAFGGTGLTSLTQWGLLYAPTSASVGAISPSTSGQPLLSTGASSAPAFGALSLSGAGITGTLGVANGGTGTSTAFTTGSIVFAGASGIYSQNNSKFFWDNTNNRLGINTASPQTQLTILSNTQTTTPTAALPAGTDLYIVGADAANTRITQDAYGTSNYPAYTGRQARGTSASPTASQTGDILAQYTGRGYGTTAFSSASVARIDMEAAENFTDSAQGTYISMHTTALGATSPTEKFRVGPSGQWGIGGATYGTSGYAFVSGGPSAAPTWSQISLTSGVTGTLPATNGGTGLSSYAVGDLLYASSTTALSRLADVATGNVLLSGGVGVAPSWGKVDLTTAVNGTLPVANGGTGQASALTQYGVVYGATTSAMGTTTAGTTGQVLVANTGGAPSWSSTVPSGAAVTSFSAGTTGLTPSTGTTGAVTLAGTLNAGSGGTGQSSYTIGDILYASAGTTLSKLAAVATGSVLVSAGVGTAPTYSATPTLTSLTAPFHYGGTSASSTLTLQSTTGIGTTDSVVIKVGNNGAVTALTAASSGTVTIGTLNLTNALGTLYGGTGLTGFTAANNAIYSTSSSALTAGTLPTAAGGTGLTSYTTGDIIYASATNTLAKLGAGTNGFILTMSGGVPVWAANTGGVSSLTAGTNISLSGSTGAITISTTANPTFATSTTSPLILGGTGTGSSLTLQSTSGVGATDTILMKVGNNGAVTAVSIDTAGIVTFPTTGAIDIPVGTTGQRPTGNTGMLRFNSTTTTFEGYNGTAWGSIGGGATGGGTDQIFWNNGQTVNTSYSIPASTNAGTFGPVTIGSSATVTVPSSSSWTVV